MRSRYWRFSFDENALGAIVESDQLPFPELNSPAAKYNSKQQVMADLRVGSIIVLANFNHFESAGTARAIGVVESISELQVKMSWKKIIPSRNMLPHKIGAEQWKKENIFCFSVPRAKEFKIDLLADKFFPKFSKVE